MTMFSIIKSGLNATGKDLAVISNNIANASTNGFKRSEAQFEDLYFSQHNNSTEKATGMGVKNIKPRQSFAQGSFQQTNGSLDLAIMGEGFFILGAPIGRAEAGLDSFKYTRDGSFQLDRLGNLVNTEGLPVLGQSYIDGIPGALNSSINVPMSLKNENGDPLVVSELRVRPDGIIEATYGLDTTIQAGRIQIADFVNEHGLQNIGTSSFQETPESGIAQIGYPNTNQLGKLLPGALEKSNTDITNELVTMLRTQQAFSGCSKLMQTDTDTIKRLIS